VTEYIQWFLVVALLLWFNLYVALFQSRKKRMSVALGLSVMVVMVLLVTDHFDEREFSSSPRYTSTMLPPAFLVVTPASKERFLAESEKVFDRLTFSKVPK
jgi:hypothetical protein